MALDSIIAYKKYGMYRSNLEYLLRNTFSIPLGSLASLDTYYIRQWEGSYVAESVARNIGRIIHEDIEYIAILRKSLYELKQGMCILSFRRAQKEFNLPAYVIIDSYKGTQKS